MAVEWVALGAAVARITLRAFALSQTAGEWGSDVADQVADAESGLQSLRQWLSGRTTGQAEVQLGQTIGHRLEAEMAAEFGDAVRSDSVSADAAAACTTATAVISGLIRGQGLSTTLTTALAHPDRMYQYAMDSGGAERRRLDLPAGLAERIFDRALRAASDELVRYAPTADLALPYALGELLRRSEDEQRQLDEVLEVTRETRAVVGELRDHASQELRHAHRERLAALQLPPFTQDDLEPLIDHNAQLLQIGEVLSSDPQPGRTLRRWVTQSPPFLAAGPAAAWIALAHALQAHGEQSAAADAFQAAIAAGAANADYLAAQAALMLLPDPDRGQELDTLLDDNPDPLAGWVRAARSEDWAAARDAATQLAEPTPRERERNAVLVAETYRQLDDPGRAIEILQAVVPASIGSGVKIELARLLLQQALQGRRPSRSSALLASLDQALLARDERRLWRGDSVDPALIAFAAAWHNGDPQQATLIVTAEPDGSASAAEMADPRTRTARAIAAARQGDTDTARDLAEGLEGFQRARVLADIESMGARPRSATAAKLWREAWDTATDDDEYLLAAQGLLMAGATAPGLDELRGRQPTAMADLDQLAEVAPRPGETANQRTTRLAKLQTSNVYAAAELGRLQAAAGRTRQAARTLSEAADHFDDQQWRLEAAAMLAQAGDDDAAGKTAAAAIAAAGDRWPGQTRARYICLESAFARRDWPAVVAHGRPLLDLTDNLEVRWALAHGLSATGDHYGAWQLLRQSTDLTLPQPPDGRTHRQNTHLRLILLSRFASRRELVAGAVEALRAYDTDEQLAGAILGIVLTASSNRPDWSEPDQAADEDLDPETAELRRQIDRFTQDFPESPYLRAIQIGDPADPDRIRAALRPLLKERSAAVGQVAEQVRNGQLPAGILADATNRHYAEVLVLRADEGQLARFADPEIDQAERAAAADSLRTNVDVMIDASALLTTSYLADSHRDACYDAVTTLCTTRDVMADLEASAQALSQRTTTTLGWDPLLDQPVRIETDARTADRRAKAADQLLALARAHALPQELTAQPVHPDLDEPTWLNLVQICKDTKAALWCDDAILRTLARAEGVATFSTIALLDHLGDTGQLTPADTDQALLDLLRARVVDLPLTEQRLKATARAEDWQPASTALAISRAAAWRTAASACVALVLEACEHNAFNSVAIAIWYSAAAQGIASLQLDPRATADLLAGLLSAVLMLPTTTGPAVAALVPTARQLTNKYELPDIWPTAIRETHRMLLKAHDEAASKMIILSLIAGLDPTDKTAAIQAMIDPTRG